MANLVFTKVGDVYVATATVNADFNLHIEKTGEGAVDVLQSGVSGGGYALVRDGRFSRYQDVIDTDFCAVVYPKYIKVVSDLNPSSAVITEKQ